jgi:multiple sugar transport system ATP-binding protein
MNVYDNLAFPLRMRKHSKSGIDERVRQVAELLRITELFTRKPKQLSGGQQQRVALGRALVREPKVFLMDEPLRNLDAKMRLYMRTESKVLQKRLGITTIYVTHDQVEAMTMADRIVIMDKGRLLQTASPDETYQRPVDTFVAGFIGSPPMNFIDCSLIEKRGRAFLDASFCIFDLAGLSDHLRESIGTETILGLRPEAISVSNEEMGVNCFKGEVYVVEPLGSEIILNIKVNDNIIKVNAPPSLKVSPGSSVWLSFKTNDVHVFDKKTGKALI